MDKQQVKWMNNKYNGQLLNKWINAQSMDKYQFHILKIWILVSTKAGSHTINQFGNETITCQLHPIPIFPQFVN